MVAARSRRPKRRNTHAYFTAPQSASPRLMRAIEELLRRIAQPLLNAGITPHVISDLAAVAFVKAACDVSQLKNGRANESRISVMTGLTRRTVRRALRGIQSGTKARKPRSTRVIEGWCSDRRFLTRSGLPRSLRLRGKHSSFESAVALYAGDVPYKAVLVELQRIGAIEERNGYVKLRLIR
jgi:hypothetical protein